jgi:hypothetical protein
MMRLIQMCLPLVLGPVLAAAQQTQPSTAQKPAQTTVTKPSSASVHKTSHRAARRRHSKASRTGAKRATYRPEYTQNSVEVISGNETRHVVFETPKPADEGTKSTPGALKVEVMNGTSTDTQYFYAGNDQPQIGADQKRPVVIDIQSSDTRTVGGNKRPVVTGVTSAGSGDAKSVDSGGQTVTKDVSPHPKRPSYQPDEH